MKEEPPISRKDSQKYDLTSDSEYEEAFMQTKMKNELEIEKLRILYQAKLEEDEALAQAQTVT